MLLKGYVRSQTLNFSLTNVLAGGFHFDYCVYLGLLLKESCISSARFDYARQVENAGMDST